MGRTLYGYHDYKKVIIYKGETRFQRPYGRGKAFRPDGSLYQEGKFGLKGLISGKEYYPGGKLRFEGIWKVNWGYGPNYPIFGKWYSPEGAMLHEGPFFVRLSKLGHPTVEIPENFGPVLQEDRVRLPLYHWGFEKDFESRDTSRLTLGPRGKNSYEDFIDRTWKVLMEDISFSSYKPMEVYKGLEENWDFLIDFYEAACLHFCRNPDRPDIDYQTSLVSLNLYMMI